MMRSIPSVGAFDNVVHTRSIENCSIFLGTDLVTFVKNLVPMLATGITAVRTRIDTPFFNDDGVVILWQTVICSVILEIV